MAATAMPVQPLTLVQPALMCQHQAPATRAPAARDSPVLPKPAKVSGCQVGGWEGCQVSGWVGHHLNPASQPAHGPQPTVGTVLCTAGAPSSGVCVCEKRRSRHEFGGGGGRWERVLFRFFVWGWGTSENLSAPAHQCWFRNLSCMQGRESFGKKKVAPDRCM